MDRVRQLLGNSYRMYYCPALLTSDLVPGQILEDIMARVNQDILENLCSWDRWTRPQRNRAAKLVRVNWIFQRLDRESIRKPILVHRYLKQWHVLCGDTRIMSLNLRSTVETVTALATCVHDQAKHYDQWISVTSDLQLADLLRFDPEHLIIDWNMAQPGLPYAIDWFEIGGAETAHHLHNENQRWQAFARWIQTHGPIELSADWPRSRIEWQNYGL